MDREGTIRWMPPRTLSRIAGPLGLAIVLVLALVAPALACDPRLSDLRDSRTWPDAPEEPDLGLRP